ncbi:MAG: 3-deoxy-7-phosphoheptulonate synthase [Oligosphaeraceae bacterium]
MLQEIDLKSPDELRRELPVTPEMEKNLAECRRQVKDIVEGRDRRLLLLVGPCSIHDLEAAREYAHRLKELSRQVSQDILVVMRTYFEKPRTTLGWKGLIYDPDLNGECNIAKGVRLARTFLLELAELGLPAATELLDPATAGYLTDLISYAGIGARTTESQPHRQMASALDVPVGFKNGTDGSIQVAIDAICTAASPHSYLGMLSNGHSGILRTAGNPDGHLVLRGGARGENYYPGTIAEALDKLREAHLKPQVVVDCSHGNSRRDYTRQHIVFENVLEQRLAGNDAIIGMMLESNLQEGRQAIVAGVRPCGGLSVTDACIGFAETERLVLEAGRRLRNLAKEEEAKRSIRVAYLGPAATFTHIAATRTFGDRVEYRSCNSIGGVLSAVEGGLCDYGVVPVENSTEGLVNGTMDALASSSLKVYEEVAIAVHQCLLSNQNREEIRVIYSHAQSLGQCRQYLERNFPDAETIATPSNARAAELASHTSGAAVIASVEAGRLYALNVLEENIEDNPDNVTRFFVLSRKENDQVVHDRCCLCFAARDKVGALYDALLPFKEAGVSLSMIESRPSGHGRWRYRFFVELDCGLQDARMPAILEELGRQADEVKVIGSYQSCKQLL